MRQLFRSSAVLAGLIVTVIIFSMTSLLQAQSKWESPRTADGQPDLQGVWSNNNATPLQRPASLADKEFLTDEELGQLQATAAKLFAIDSGDAAFGDSVFEAALAATENFSSRDTQTGNYNQFWMVEREWNNRTSLIVDPANGRLPANTQQARKRQEAYAEGRNRHAEWTDDRSLGERCITFGAPRLGAGYNSYYQIFQTKTHVVLLMEMAHDARIIPIGDSADLDKDIRLWHGNSRGHWEGNTFVVETTNYSPQIYFMGANENLHVTERFTRIAPDVLEYEVRFEDPTTWLEPWTAVLTMNKSDDALYEYACHEGNIGMEGILSGARFLEKAASEGGGQ